MKDLDHGGSARQSGRSKDDSGGDNKSDSWVEVKESSYRVTRRRESRWDESENAKHIWHANSEDRMGQGHRFRGGREWTDMGNDMLEDGRDDRREDYHIRRVKDVVESNMKDVESWDRSVNRRQDHRDDDEKLNDRQKSSKDRDDIVEGRGRPIPKIQDEDQDYGDKSTSKEEFFREEDGRRRGWKSTKLGHGVKRSWSPLRRRGRVEQDDFDKEWADDRRDERAFRREHERDRDRIPDRELDLHWDRDRDFGSREIFREEGDLFRDRTRDREDPERWKHRQRDRPKENNDDAEYNFERDGWEVPRREKERAERDHKGEEDRKDKDSIDVLKSPQNSGILSDAVERTGGNSNTSIDFVRERGFGSGSPYISRRDDSGPLGDFLGNNGDADWMGDERHRHTDSDYQDRNFFEDEHLLGLDQNFGRRGGDASIPLTANSGRGRGQKGSPGQRGRGGDGRPSFANNQGAGMMMRGLQQSGKGGRSRTGGKGSRGGARDSQRGGGMPPPLMIPGPGSVPVPGPGMVPHFGAHMGPPASLQVLMANMGPGPAPGVGPSGFPLPPFGGPVAWGGGRGTTDMGMHPGPPGTAPPVHAPGPGPPRYGPNMGPGPAGHGVFFSSPRGASNMMQGPSYGGATFGGRSLLPEKAPMSRLPPRVNAPAGLAPSRGEQNDYSQHFVDTGLRPQNFIRDVDVGDRFEEYPKLKELITRKDKLITDHACPPMYMQADLRALELSSEVFGTKFDVILVDPPWEEYVRRAPGVGDSMEWWSFEEIQSLRIEAIADTPSFIFLWVGDAEGLDQGRLCLKKWGFRRCEDICWVKTNKENPTPALRHDASTLLQHSKEHCLMGIRGTVRRSSDAHIIHANIDTDIIISEEPPYGSTAKPEELYHIVEHFALGQRRLELFGEDHNIRAGWITVGKHLTSSNFNAQTYCKYVGDADGKVWQGGRGNPPLDAPHLVGTTPEIEALRPKSPPPRAQQQLSQAANSASQPLSAAAHSNSKKAGNASSQGLSPQNAQGSSAGAGGHATNSSSVIVISTTSTGQGHRGGSNKQGRWSLLHVDAGQGMAGCETDKATGHDMPCDAFAAPAAEDLMPSKDTAS